MKRRRYSFFIDEPQLADLKRLAAHNGMTPSENIRRAIQARLNASGLPPQVCPTCKQPTKESA